MRPIIDIAGQRFGDLVALRVDSRTTKGARWLCACDCGASKVVYGQHLRSGLARSCGCSRGTHHRSSTAVYRVWTSMVSRCHGGPRSSGYELYGGRGIQVCDRWRTSFENFLADMGERPPGRYSIDRVNGDGNYEPGNCRWATAEQQHRNRRNTRLIRIDGQELTYKEVSARTGLPIRRIRSRHEAGWSALAIMTVPVVPPSERREYRPPC